jgi:SulP family sulfate permease
MGGCAMLGQSLINVSNGANKTELFAIALYFCHVWCWSNRNFTNGCSYWTDDYGCHWNFEWASLKTFNKMPKSDILSCLS